MCSYKADTRSLALCLFSTSHLPHLWLCECECLFVRVQKSTHFQIDSTTQSLKKMIGQSVANYWLVELIYWTFDHFNVFHENRFKPDFVDNLTKKVEWKLSCLKNPAQKKKKKNEQNTRRKSNRNNRCATGTNHKSQMTKKESKSEFDRLEMKSLSFGRLFSRTEIALLSQMARRDNLRDYW